MAGYYKAGEGAPMRTKEDQELWDKVAFEAWIRGLTHVQTEEDHRTTLEASMYFADAFMAERAKRMGES